MSFHPLRPLIYLILLAATLVLGSAGWNHLAHAPAVKVTGLDGLRVLVSVLPDPGGMLGFADLQTRTTSAAFQTMNEGLRAGKGHVPHWFRIDIAVPPEQSGQTAYLRVMPPNLDDVRFFGPNGRAEVSGLAWPLSRRQQAEVTPAIRVVLVAPSTRIVVRALTSGTLVPYFGLLSERAFRASVEQYLFLLGLYGGALVLTLAINGLNWWWTGQPLYRAYTVFVLTVILQGLWTNGLASVYLLPERPDWVTRLDDVWPGLMGAAAVFFSVHILRLDSRRPAMAKRCRQFGWSLTAVAPLAFTPAWTQILPFVLLTLIGYGALTMAISATDWRQRGTLTEGLVLGAYVSFMIFQSVTMLAMLGVLPASSWTVQSWQFGTLIHLLLLHVATASRLHASERAGYAAAQQATLARAEAEEAQQRQRDLRRFLGMLAHELNTPLTLIDTTIQSLSMLPGAEAPAVSTRYQRIRRTVNRLAALVRQSLARERLDAGGWQLQWESFYPDSLIDAVLALHNLQLPDEGFSRLPIEVAGQPGALSVERPAPLPRCEGDPQLLQIVLGNLLDNACKYADAGSEIELSVQFSDASGKICWSVTNQGGPIPEAELPQLFEKYYRGGEHSQATGAGLGLYLVRHIVRLHGGRVSVANLPGRLIKFSVEFPINRSASHA